MSALFSSFFTSSSSAFALISPLLFFLSRDKRDLRLKPKRGRKENPWPRAKELKNNKRERERERRASGGASSEEEWGGGRKVKYRATAAAKVDIPDWQSGG